MQKQENSRRPLILSIAGFLMNIIINYNAIVLRRIIMDVKKNIERLQDNIEKRYVLQHAMTVLSYDAETVMPAGGGDRFGETMGALAEMQYGLLVNDEFRSLMKELLEQKKDLPIHLQREVEELHRTLKQIEVIPVEEYSAFESAQAHAGVAWRKAKDGNDWEMFRPHLEKLLEYAVRFKRYYDAKAPIYDLMLDDYEHGLNAEMLDGFFATLREELVPLIHEIAEKPQPDISFLQKDYPPHIQEKLARWLMEVMTLDTEYCSLGQTEHPFTTSVSNKDVRITTHYYPEAPLSSVFSVIHEGGHALYMMHTADELNGLSLAEGASCSIHESMSRFMENIIGRSEAFTAFLLPKLQELFPEQMQGVDAKQLWLACNRAEPSLIRVEADELTYPLHIMVRYELEKRMVSGELAVSDLPEEWNRLYKEYLGVDVPDDSHGVLQDMHWSDASFGYFPTYALGSAYSAQILAAMEKDLDVWGLVGRGEFRPLVEWLTEKLYRFGGVKTASQLIQDICGEPFDPHYYMDYLKTKYRKVYGL